MVTINKCKLCGNENQDEFYSYRKTRCKSCICAKQRAFNSVNPIYLRSKNQRRRARILSLQNDLKPQQWKEVVDHFDGRCFLTGSTDIVMEHVVPLNNLHLGTSINNVLPMDATLNLRKGKMNLLDFFNTLDATLQMHRNFDKAIEYLAALNGLNSSDYIDFIYHCESNKRTLDEASSEANSSVNEWKQSRIENVYSKMGELK